MSRAGAAEAPAAGMCMRTAWAVTPVQRLRGLLGRSPKWLGPAGVLVIAPCDDVHTFFMRHPIDIAFLDSAGMVLESFSAVGPARRIRCPGAVVVLERFSRVEQPSGGRSVVLDGAWIAPGQQVALGPWTAGAAQGCAARRCRSDAL